MLLWLRQFRWDSTLHKLARELGSGHHSISVSWMELDEGLYANVCFAKGKLLLVRPLKKTAHSGSKGSLISPGAQDGRVSCKSPEHREPHFSSTMDSAFPVVHCPGSQDLSCRKGHLHGARAGDAPGDSTPPSALQKGCQ